MARVLLFSCGFCMLLHFFIMYVALSAQQSDLISFLICLYYCLFIKSDLPFNFLLSSIFSTGWSYIQCCPFLVFLLSFLSAAVINTSLILFPSASGSSLSMSCRMVAYLLLISTEYSLSTVSQSKVNGREPVLLFFDFNFHAHIDKFMVRVTICTKECFNIQH